MAPLVSEASLQTFQDAELLQRHAKFVQMFFFCRRGRLAGLFWAGLATLAASPVVRLISAAAGAPLN